MSNEQLEMRIRQPFLEKKYETFPVQVVLDIYHPHICLFLDVCQVFICFSFSIYKFIDLETYFRIWNIYKIGTYRGIRKTRDIYQGLPVVYQQIRLLLRGEN